MIRSLLRAGQLAKPLTEAVKIGDASVVIRNMALGANAYTEVDGARDQATSTTLTSPATAHVQKETDINMNQYPVHRTVSAQKLHLNFEDLPTELHAPFVKYYLESLIKDLEDHDIETVNFNHVNEDVFRYQLNMELRRLGYSSYFMKNNHDKGLATFEKLV